MGIAAHSITRTAQVHKHKQCRTFRQVRLYTQTATSSRLSPTVWPAGRVFAATSSSQIKSFVYCLWLLGNVTMKGEGTKLRSGGEMMGQQGRAVVSRGASPQGSRFESQFGQGLSVWRLHVLPLSAWVFSGYSGFLSQSTDTQIGVNGNSTRPKIIKSIAVTGVHVHAHEGDFLVQ